MPKIVRLPPYVKRVHIGPIDEDGKIPIMLEGWRIVDGLIQYGFVPYIVDTTGTEAYHLEAPFTDFLAVT